MSEFRSHAAETNIAKAWVQENKPVFDWVRGEPVDEAPQLTLKGDIEYLAQVAGRSVEEFFSQISREAGNLGAAALKLVYSDVENRYGVEVGTRSDWQ